MAQGIAIAIGALILIIFLSIQAEQGGLLRNTSTQSSSDAPQTERRVADRDEVIQSEPERALTYRERQEIEEAIDDLYDELDSLSEEVRRQRLREPASPHADLVSLNIGNARNTDPEREYLTLRTERSNNSPVNISDWYLESYVTDRRVAIPRGARVLGSFRSDTNEDIQMLPDERAYLLTTETPLNVSFHENQCSGYLRHEEDFYPSLRSHCPAPIEELEWFSNVPLDDDICYDYVESLRRCELVSERDIEEIDDLSGRCKRFLEDSLNYNSCTRRHMNDPLFDDVGSWRIYLDRRDELWRREREIIRLMDERDRVIDVIEY